MPPDRIAPKYLPPVLVGLYFGMALTRLFSAKAEKSAIMFLHFLSLPIVLVALLILAGWSAFSMHHARRAGREPKHWHAAALRCCAVGWVALSLLVIVSVLTRNMLPPGSGAHEFDAIVWHDPQSRAAMGADLSPRQKMLRSVVEDVLAGHNKEEIEAALGSSEDVRYFHTTGRDLVYVLGPERNWLAIDHEWLLIWLDDNERFERYQLMVD